MRLNLGCGYNKREGFVNVDSSPHCAPDLIHDLEEFPWPWADSSIDEILMVYVLEHLGATTEVYFPFYANFTGSAATMRESPSLCRIRAMTTSCMTRPTSAP